jgi:porin
VDPRARSSNRTTSVTTTCAVVVAALAAQVAVAGRACADEGLSGDWGGGRTWLADHGILVEPRVTQFYQGLAAGDGDLGYDYGGKADLLITTDFSRLGFWDGLSMTLHGEYNFGNSVNGRGGVLIPVNAALNFPGMDGADAYDLSSLYFVQEFGDSNTVVFGKINMIDIVSGRRPFLGGAGVDAFWNLTFVAPPTGTVPAYLLGALLTVRTEQTTYRLWVYDPASYVNKLSLADAFEDGVTIRGSVQVPVTIAGRRGNQGFTALYSTQDGTDLSNLDEILVPTPEPGTVATKNSRYYFAYSFDQYLYQPAASPEEGVGLFGQLGISDGNPNALHWSFLVGLGGTGLVPGRSGDNWGIGYYYDSLSEYLKDALAPIVRLRDEQGLEIFYNVKVTPWLSLGADLQVIRPGLSSDTAVLPGLRAVIRF